MSGYHGRLLLTLRFMASVDASTPQDWNEFAAPDALVKKINVGKADATDFDGRQKAATLTQTASVLPKGQLKTAMEETSSEEIPPPPPPMDDSHVWVEPKVDETPTSAAALSSSGMLRREAPSAQKGEESIQNEGIGKLRPHEFSPSQDTVSEKEQGASDDPSSHPTAEDLGESQMHLLEEIDGEQEEEEKHGDARSLLNERNGRAAGCSRYTSQGQSTCDKAGAFCGWRTVNGADGSQPYCADCSVLSQADCISTQNKGQAKCTWASTTNTCNEGTSSSLQQTRTAASFVQQQQKQPIQKMNQVGPTEKLHRRLPLGALLKKLMTSPRASGHEQSLKANKRGPPESMAQAFSYGRDASNQAPSTVPIWFHGGNAPGKNNLKFEYQAAIGRDGFEPDPTEPAAEYFGPFKIDYNSHTIYLNNWNLHLGTRLPRYGMGNLVVGNNHTYNEARNGVLLGDSNVLKGSYGLVTGQYNMARGRGAVVDGGRENSALAEYSSVQGGEHNNVTSMFASVQGGRYNSATAPFASVGGGEHNVADGYSSAVEGGKSNQALANLSSVLGGYKNMIPGIMVSQTIAGGKSGNVPTQEPSETLIIEPGEHVPNKPDSTHELDFSKLGCASAKECEQEEEEEEEDEEEEEGNPATRTRRVSGGNQIDENGQLTNRRRTSDAHTPHIEGLHQFAHLGQVPHH